MVLGPGGTVVEKDIEAQCRSCFDNVRAVMLDAGVPWENVVDVLVFLTDMNDYAAMNEIYMEEFGDHRPARSAVAVKELPLGAKIEIEAIAAV